MLPEVSYIKPIRLQGSFFLGPFSSFTAFQFFQKFGSAIGATKVFGFLQPAFLSVREPLVVEDWRVGPADLHTSGTSCIGSNVEICRLPRMPPPVSSKLEFWTSRLADIVEQRALPLAGRQKLMNRFRGAPSRAHSENHGGAPRNDVATGEYAFA